MFRRKLLFNIPPGNEKPYWQIPPQFLLGKVWAPIYHGYGYYIDGRTIVPSAGVTVQSVHNQLTTQAQVGLAETTLIHALSLAWGTKSALKLAATSVLFSELESYWAVHMENAVSFGSSHSIATAAGHILLKFMLTKKPTWLQIFAAVVASFQFGTFGFMWIKHGFKAVGPAGKIHRMDHVAHIGGMLTGALSAYFV